MNELIKCNQCEATLAKEEACLSRKLLGIQTKEGYCLHCLAQSTGSTVEQLQADIARYQAEGCLFFL